MRAIQIILILCGLSLASAYSVRGFLDGAIPNGPALSFDSSTALTLRSADTVKKTYVQSDKESFVFLNVSEGSFVLSVQSTDHIFPSLRVDVLEGSIEVYLTSPGSEWDYKGPRQPYPIEIKPLGGAIYYQNREGFNVFKLFKNPMLIISLLTLLMVIVIPKIASSIDPEDLKAIQKQQASSTPNIPNPMNFDVAGYLAGSTSSTSSSDSAKTTGARNRKH